MLVVFLVSCGSKEDDQNAENTKTKTLSLKAAVPGTSQEIPTYDPDGGGWEVEKWNHKISKSLKFKGTIFPCYISINHAV